MRIFDFSIQCLIFAVALLSALTGKDFIIWLAFIQFFMGAWQLLSALVNTILMKRLPANTKRQFRYYWLGVLVYFVVMAILFTGFGRMTELLPVAWFFVAWLLAIYYFIITTKLVFYQNKRSTYLDIANN